MKKNIFLTIFIIQCFSINLHAQQILYASPNKLQPDAFYNVLFYCTGTHFTSSKPSLKFTKTGYEYIAKILVYIQNDTTIRLILSTNTYEIQSGIYDIVISDSIDGTMILPKGLEIVAPPEKPSLVSFSPDTCNRGDTITMRIVGHKTFFNKINVEITGIYLKSDVISASYDRVYYNDTVMDVKFQLPHQYYGLCDFLYWGKKEGTIRNYGMLFIIPPDKPAFINHLSEDSIVRGKSSHILIYGSNTHFSLQTSKWSMCLKMDTFSFYPTSFTVLNDTLIDAEFFIPLYANGLLKLVIENTEDDKMILNNCLLVIIDPDNPPSIKSVLPDTAIQNNWATFTVICKNTLLTLDKPSVFLTKVSFTSIQADSVYINNETTLRAVFWIDKTTEPGKWSLMISDAFNGIFTADSVINIKKEVGIWDRETIEYLSISPNPMDEYTVISFSNPENKVFNLLITDLYGRVIYHNTTVKSEKIKLLRDEMKPGFYIVALSNEASLRQMKLIVR